MTLGPRLRRRQDAGIHKSADSGDSAHIHSTNLPDGPREGPIYPHTPVPHELERAYRTAKQLAEQLELANQVVLQRLALYIRGQVAELLVALDEEVPG